MMSGENRQTRFAVLKHSMPKGHPRATHFDLLIEVNGRLWSWALDQWPCPRGHATRLPDHGVGYLEYEGPISNDRGHVKRIDSGTCWIQYEAENDLTLTLVGHLCGDVQISLKQDANDAQRWSLNSI